LRNKGKFATVKSFSTIVFRCSLAGPALMHALVKEPLQWCFTWFDTLYKRFGLVRFYVC